MSGVTAEAGRILLKRNSDPVQMILVQIIRKKTRKSRNRKRAFLRRNQAAAAVEAFLAKRAAYAFSGTYTGQQESDAGFLP